MKRSLFVFVFLFLSIKLIPAPFDSGMISWTQPDGTFFIAQLIRDEFTLTFTTNDGYEIREGTDGWFYYATKDNNGKIIPGDLKVGKGIFPTLPQDLTLGATAQYEIDQRKLDFQQGLLDAEAWYSQKIVEANGELVKIHVGVILVDFADHRHYTGLDYPNGYPTHYFNNMLFSQNTYIDLEGGHDIHPDKEPVFGSMRDYLNQQSCGKLDITGKKVDGLDVYTNEILNPSDPSGFPQWLYLNGSKDYWDTVVDGGVTKIPYDQLTQLVKQQLNVDLIVGNKKVYDKLILIYAGDVGRKQLWPATTNGQISQIGEQYENFIDEPPRFTHIGTYCHEFGHLLGAPDEGLGNVRLGYWDLMDIGTWNGPERKGECPAGYDPYYKIKWKWVTPNYFNESPSNQTQTVQYNYNSPKYYKLDSPIDPLEYFLIENRGRNGFDRYTPNNFNYTPPNNVDVNSNLGGLMIWTIDGDGRTSDYSDIVGLKSAMTGVVSNLFGTENNFGASDPFPYSDGQDITQNTFPNNSIRNVLDSKVKLENITWESNGSILVDISRTSQNDIELVTGIQEWTTNRTITKDIILLGGATLTLGSGVKLEFYQNKKIKIFDNATLIIESGANPVILTNYNNGGKWGGIEMLGEHSRLLASNLIIQYAVKCLSFSGLKSVLVNSITFNNNDTFCDLNGATNIEISSCRFNSTKIDLGYYNNSSISIKFSNNVFLFSSISMLGQIDFDFINNDFRTPYGTPTSFKFPGGNNIIKNNIFLNSDILNTSLGNSIITYNCVYPAPSSTVATLFSSEGNFSADPLFADPGNLESQSLQQSSPCIDMGDPTMDYNNEPGSKGGRINIGSLGNTTLATVVAPNTSRNLSAISMLGNLSLSQSSTWCVNSATPYSIGVNKTLEIPNLTVNSGSTLNISNGATLNCLNGGSLFVNGTLNANGTSSNKVCFDFKQIDWTTQNGLKILSGGLANISNAIIKNAKYGVYNYEGISNISGSEILSCFYGIYLYKNNYASVQSQIINNNIHNNCPGIHMYASSPDIRNNTIYNNYYGVYCWNYSSPYLGNYELTGDNNIHNNYIGFYATDHCFPFLGRTSCLFYGGNNKIQDSQSYNMYAYWYCDITAENNWWGADPPDVNKIQATYYSTISYIPWLQAPPLGQIRDLSSSPEEVIYDNNFPKDKKQKNDSKQNIENSYKGSSQKQSIVDVDKEILTSYKLDWPIHWKLLYARSLIGVKKFKQAQSVCKEVILNHSDSTSSAYALDLLWQASRQYDEDSLKTFLNFLSNKNEKNKLYASAESILAGYDKKNKVQRFDKILKKYRGEQIIESVLLSKFLYHYHELDDKENAQLILAQIDMLFPNSSSAIEAHNLMGDNQIKAKQASSAAKIAETEMENTTLPTEYKLLGNYPNPFNPSTTISYALPFESNVEINIFDIMGRLIRTFNINSQNAGYQNVLWNGKNENNEQVASGIYLYRFKAIAIDGKVFEKTSKLLMLK